MEPLVMMTQGLARVVPRSARMISHVTSQIVSLLFLSGLVLSCTAPRWEHPTQGVQRLEEDRTDCMHQATVEHMQADPHTGTVFDKQESVKRCLMTKGYIQRSQD
jgi:hypothetical protein